MSVTTSAQSATPSSIRERDPYKLDPADIQDPPRGWRQSWKFFGPGFVTSAAVVGSGELITATALGAKVGFLLLWLVLVSTFVKVAVQIELARWSISTGKTSVTGYNDVTPKIAGRGWISYIGVLMILQIVIGQGGVLGTGALALSMVMPVGGDPFSLVSIATWVTVIVVLAVAVHLTNRYGVIEKVSTVLVALVTLGVIAMVIGLQFTPFAWSATDIAEGMQFKIQVGTMGVALAMFGMTGVGGGEITAYSYWVVEKGYARFAGPNDGSQAWVDRARGWISVMKKDAFLSWVIYTVSTAAFFILGAAVLHPQGLVPEGTEVLEVLSRMFTDVAGDWTKTIFLVGAAAALIKTILANVPGFARQVSNTLAIFGAFDWNNVEVRNKWLRVLMIALPIVWGAFYLFVQSPVAMIIIAGIGNAVYLMAIVVAVWYLGRTQTDPRVKDGSTFKLYLVISSLAVFAVGLLSLLDLMGISIA
ncbi:Nramp family divalent metal transporter [Georgenia yuyongxinii]|uniref:Divalent metal cation transporter n=1 Tax=Georgenia yuyongxinii TaxID=2589797 RepID=A0A552WPT8_9MICO|nr:Nramp family divalent metal transporter [Georgenia yuyongxinii]TRW44801.1 divalent metal cation transporter [Georgenia yuyongxinii]